MRILFIMHSTLLAGGTANSFLTILNNLPSIVEQVYVLVPAKGTLSKKLSERNISVWTMDYKPAWTSNRFITAEDILIEWNNMQCARKLAQKIKNNNIDIVYTVSGTVDVGAMAALFAGKRHIWHQREFIHNHFQKKYILEWKTAWLLKHSDAVVTMSKCLLKELKKRYHIKNGIVLYNKYDRDKYYTERKDLFSTETIKCLVTGVIYEGKHQMDAVQTIGRLIGEYNIPFELYLAGGGTGEYIVKINHLVETLNLKDKIHIMSYVEDMQSLRKRMDVEISCSQWEAFSRSVIEGMLSGLLVIGANSGATPEQIKHNKNGLLYQPEDVDDLVRTLMWVYNHRSEAKAIARRGQRWADKFYTDNNFGKDLERILIN